MSNPLHDATDPEPPYRWPGAASTPRVGPTGPEDYALLNGVFIGGATALLVAATRRGTRGDQPIGRGEVPLLALASFALAQVIAKEKVGTWLREPFVEETGDHRPARPEGSGVRYAVGELLTCTRCLGTWAALALVGLRTVAPPAGRAATTLLSTAGANSFLQASFRLLSERANRESAETVAAGQT